jgi:hypothetical protein
MSDKQKTGSAKQKVVFKGFHNPMITPELKACVKGLNMESGSCLERIVQLVRWGYKLSIVSDAAETYFTVTLYDQRPASESAGYAMSVRHADVAVAVALTWFLIDEIYENQSWIPWIENKNDYDW